MKLKNNEKPHDPWRTKSEDEWPDEEWGPDPEYRAKEDQAQNSTEKAKKVKEIAERPLSAERGDVFVNLAASLLEDATSKDPEYQRRRAKDAADILSGYKFAEEFIREHKLVPEDRLREIDNKLSTPFTRAEDRILNALATLLEEAKGKDPAHQRAMARATADITGALKGIRELRQKDAAQKSTERSTARDESAGTRRPAADLDSMERAKRQALDPTHRPSLDRQGGPHAGAAPIASNQTLHH